MTQPNSSGQIVPMTSKICECGHTCPACGKLANWKLMFSRVWYALCGNMNSYTFARIYRVFEDSKKAIINYTKRANIVDSSLTHVLEIDYNINI